MKFEQDPRQSLYVQGANSSLEAPITAEGSTFILSRAQIGQISALPGDSFRFYLPPELSPQSRRTIAKNAQFANGQIEVDPKRLGMEVNGVFKPLSRIEFQLIYSLAIEAPKVVDREVLCDLLWPNGLFSEKALAINIIKVRRKLGQRLGDREFGAIRTVRGVGYRAVLDLMNEDVS